jgi:hypothetical protein
MFIKEEGDEQLVNEEPTSRCNAINIIPQTIEENDNDVVIVRQAPKKNSFFARLRTLFSFTKNKKK